MFIVEEIVTLLQERWKYLLGAYMAGYFISLMQSGVPNIYYLVPLKPYAILIGWALGNVSYKIVKEVRKRAGAKLPMYMNFYYGIKYGIPAMIMAGIYALLISILGFIFKFDISPFTAPF